MTDWLADYTLHLTTTLQVLFILIIMLAGINLVFDIFLYFGPGAHLSNKNKWVPRFFSKNFRERVEG
jgi:hypothetical protein